MSEPVTLSVALPNNILKLASIFTAAFSDDAHTQLKVQSQPLGTQETGMAQGLEHWICDAQRIVVIKAVVKNQIVGWAAWGWSGIELALGKEWLVSDQLIKHWRSVQKNTASSVKTDELSGNEGHKSGVQKLEDITNADMSNWQKTFQPTTETKCMILIAISILPNWQRRGIGSALLRWGTDRADQADVFTWVSSSDGAWEVYEKQGFVSQGELSLNLDAFADGVKRDGTGRAWGQYVWRYGRREAKSNNEAKVECD